MSRPQIIAVICGLATVGWIAYGLAGFPANVLGAEPGLAWRVLMGLFS